MSTKQVTKRKERLDSAYIHNYDQKLARLYQRLESEISAENFKIVKDYDVDAITQTIGKAARIKHLGIILQMARNFDKPWEEVTAREVKQFISEVIEKHPSKGDETWTTADFKKVVKIFFRWLYYVHRSSKITCKKHKMMDSPVTEDISISKVRNKLAREDLLKESEKSRLLHACGENLRDKAILSVKFEAGDRAGELMTAQIKHVKSDEYGAVIHVDGKTGGQGQLD